MTEQLRAFIEVRSEIEVLSATDARIVGRLELTPEAIERVRRADRYHLTEPYVLDAEGNERHIDSEIAALVGQSVEITLIPSNGRLGIEYFDKFSDLVRYHRTRPPDSTYFIYSLSFHSESDDVPDEVSHYVDVLSLVDLLRSTGDYYNDRIPHRAEVIFFEGDKIVIPLVYNDSHLRSLAGIHKLHADLVATEDAEQRRQILRSTIVDRIRSVSVSERFEVLLAEYDAVLEDYQKGFQTYLRKFSYEKLRSAMDRERVEYLHKLHDAILGIQNKLVTIPVAFVVIGTVYSGAEDAVLSNVVTLVASFVYGAVLFLILWGQWIGLRGVHSDIEHSRGVYRQHFPSGNMDVESNFNKLDRSYRVQRNILLSFVAIVLVLWVFSVAIFVWTTR